MKKQNRYIVTMETKVNGCCFLLQSHKSKLMNAKNNTKKKLNIINKNIDAKKIKR